MQTLIVGKIPSFNGKFPISQTYRKFPTMHSMPSLKEIVEIRLEELKLSPIEAAAEGGLERTFIRDIVEGRKLSVRADKIERLARALRLDPSALGRNEMVALRDVKNLPPAQHPLGNVRVIGRVAANTWLDVDEMDFGFDDISYVPSASGYPESMQFGLVVTGNCLNKIARDGDVLVCLDVERSQIDILAGDLVVVQRSRFQGQMIERTAKRVHQTMDGFELWPESDDPAHQSPIKLNRGPETEGIEVKIIGKVLWILRKP